MTRVFTQSVGHKSIITVLLRFDIWQAMYLNKDLVLWLNHTLSLSPVWTATQHVNPPRSRTIVIPVYTVPWPQTRTTNSTILTFRILCKVTSLVFHTTKPTIIAFCIPCKLTVLVFYTAPQHNYPNVYTRHVFHSFCFWLNGDYAPVTCLLYLTSAQSLPYSPFAHPVKSLVKNFLPRRNTANRMSIRAMFIHVLVSYHGVCWPRAC